MSYYMRGRVDNAIIGYFKENGAISVESAIIPNHNELRKRLKAKSDYNINLPSYSFLFSTNDGKYYFNQEVYDSRLKSSILMAVGVVFVVAIVVGLTFLLN